jgi:hypothetical protein
LLHVVEQTPRRGHQDIDPAAQVGDLRIDADAAKDGQRVDRQMLAVGANAFLNLDRQFAGRHQDQHARPLGGAGIRATGQAMQDGQREAGRLAGAGLREAIRSWPAITAGMAFCWIGVGVS